MEIERVRVGARPEEASWVRAWDRAAEATAGIDAFCSSTAWCLPAWQAFSPGAELLLGRCEAGQALLLVSPHPEFGLLYRPAEAQWGFASGLVGGDLPSLAVEAVTVLSRTVGEGLFALAGFPAEPRLHRALAAAARPVARVALGPVTGRQRASLEGGFSSYMDRRTRSFRRLARRALRAAEALGITFESPPAGERWEAVFARVRAVEACSWKGREGVGISGEDFARFYDCMGARLWREGRLRILFGRRGGRDVSYHFGAVAAGVYRGLQHAYDDDYRKVGLGVATHLEMVRRVAGEGVPLYDLGQEIAYKARWAEGELTTRIVYLALR